MFRLVAQGCEVGDQANAPEQRGNRRIGRDRKHVPEQRTSKLRPHPQNVRVREHPVGDPGRPVCSSGKSPAQETAKRVMASANRLIELRHCCRSKRRIAEISVPACPIPIHHTKLMISQPHITGLLMPQTPTPRYSSQVIESPISCSKPNPIPNTMYQGRVCLFCCKMMLSMRSSIFLYVCSPVIRISI